MICRLLGEGAFNLCFVLGSFVDQGISLRVLEVGLKDLSLLAEVGPAMRILVYLGF